MRLIANDPYVSADRAEQVNVRLVSLEDLVTEADFVTLHVVKTPETIGLVDGRPAGQGQARSPLRERLPWPRMIRDRRLSPKRCDQDR